MSPHVPQGALATAKCHEASDEWPSLIEIVAYFGKDGRKDRRRSIAISADEFFGRGAYGAPLSGTALIAMADRLRKRGPSGDVKS
jgi:hypothetical protein